MFSHYDRNNNGNLEREELEQVTFFYFTFSMIINLIGGRMYFMWQMVICSSRKTKTWKNYAEAAISVTWSAMTIRMAMENWTWMNFTWRSANFTVSILSNYSI